MKTNNRSITDRYGNKTWFEDGKIHRVGLPAMMYNGAKSWYNRGKLHRRDGPAVITARGDKCWYVNGRYITSFRLFQRLTRVSDARIVFLKLKWGNIE